MGGRAAGAGSWGGQEGEVAMPAAMRNGGAVVQADRGGAVEQGRKGSRGAGVEVLGVGVGEVQVGGWLLAGSQLKSAVQV